MARLLLALAPLIAAGCSSEPTVTATNSSVEEVQNRVAAAGGSMEMRPGRWEGTMTVKDATAPGTNPAARPGKVESQPLKVCITAEQLKPGANPFVARLQAGCKYDRFKMEGGRIDAAMTCQHPGVTMKSLITGEFTADTYRLHNVAEMSGPAAGPLGGVKSESTIETRRTGECRGDEDKI